MSSQSSIIAQLKSQYFWDVDVNKLDTDADKRLIIERVFNLGDLKEINLIVEYYGRNIVLDVLYNINYFDPKTINFITKFFKVPKKNFKCYTRKQLKPQYWS